MADELRLDLLPTEVLLLIFDYCRVCDLVSLSQVCQRFDNIVAADILWVVRRDKPLVTNQTAKKFRDRCNILLDLRERWEVWGNWWRGRYRQKILLSWEKKAMPWIRLTKQTLWWSNGNELCGFPRRQIRNLSRCLKEGDEDFFREKMSSDICKFVVRDGYVVSGHRDGGITLWDTSYSDDCRFDVHINNAHSDSVNGIDEFDDIIVTGSSDGTVKLWSLAQNNLSCETYRIIDVGDRVWSVAIDPVNFKIAVGSSGHNGVPSLSLFDMEDSNEEFPMKHHWKKGAGVFDMSWEDRSTLLTCGNDTYVRKWDIRTEKCVASWADPTDAAVYSLSTDYSYTIVTGTNYNCKAVLWDQRMTNYVQLYFLPNVGKRSSPVYSVSFDSSSFYGTTDRRLIEFSFTGETNQERDYRGILCYKTPKSAPSTA